MAPRNRNSRERSLTSDSTYSRAEFEREFPDDAACLDWLMEHRFGGTTVYCVNCERDTKHHRVQSRPSYSCQFCGHHVHPLAGTIFEKSSTSLVQWFQAIFLMSSTRCGISAKQLEREIGVTYKTACRMFHLIRTLLSDDSTPLGGKVEVDETYFAKSRRGVKSKRPQHLRAQERTVLGMVERKGRVVALHVANARTATVLPLVKQRVLPSAVVFTDELRTYQTLGEHVAEHKRIKHSAQVYVDGDVHTQTIEGFWSLLKRGLSGVYHSVGEQHLQSYLDEYSFRYNHRNDAQPMFRTMLERVDRPSASS